MLFKKTVVYEIANDKEVKNYRTVMPSKLSKTISHSTNVVFLYVNLLFIDIFKYSEL